MTDEHDLSRRVREQAERYRASDSLKAAIRTQVTLAAASERTQKGDRGLEHGKGRPLGPLRRWLGDWRASFALGAACGALALLAWLQLPAWRTASPPAGLSHWVDAHVYSMASGDLPQISSTDRHLVKPWFQGKLDFAPPVPDLSNEGYPLVGAKLSGALVRTQCELVYAKNRHLISVFVFLPPSEGVSPITKAKVRGFATAQWQESGLGFVVVSDTDAASLERFVDRYRRAASRL